MQEVSDTIIIELFMFQGGFFGVTRTSRKFTFERDETLEAMQNLINAKMFIMIIIIMCTLEKLFVT